MNDAGIYLKHYPESKEIHASPSVLTWRILVKVVQRLVSTLTCLDISKNTGVDLEVNPVLNLSLSLYLRVGKPKLTLEKKKRLTDGKIRSR